MAPGPEGHDEFWARMSNIDHLFSPNHTDAFSKAQQDPIPANHCPKTMVRESAQQSHEKSALNRAEQ